MSGAFAGGSVSGGPSAAGTSEVAIDALGDGGVNLRAVAVIPCGSGTSEAVGEGEISRQPDGTFTARMAVGPQRRDPGFSSRMQMTGTVAAERVVGRLTVTTSFRGRRRCRAVVPFEARRAPALGAGPAPPPAGGVLLGAAQRGPDNPYAFNLRVSADGRRVARAVTTYLARCRNSPADLEETNYSPSIPIRPDGSFRRTERFVLRYTDATERVTVVTAGRFVAGGATGTIRARSVARSRRTGRIVDRCDSGTRTWQAAG